MSSRTLAGKVAIVTGASKGIGGGIATAMAAAGAAVTVNYANDREGAEKVVKSIASADGQAIAVQADVSKSESIQRLFVETKKAFGQIDVLVNNAAIFKFEAFDTITEAEFHRHYNTNVLGPLLAIQEALKYFGPAGGSIINVSSVVGMNPGARNTLYASTKGALNALTRSAAVALGPRNVRVNAIAPGLTETEGAHAHDFFGNEVEKRLVAATPLGRFAQPKDIAPAVVFLASDAGAWITGETLRVSGGLQ